MEGVVGGAKDGAEPTSRSHELSVTPWLSQPALRVAAANRAVALR